MAQRRSTWRVLHLAALPLLCLWSALASGHSAQPTSPPAPRAVVLVTMDGVRWDYPGRDRLPAFAAMAAAGLHPDRLEPPFPSLTFASHASLATGCLPARHGIVANSFLDPRADERFSDEKEASWLQEPPLWVLAEKAGMKSAVAGWPCSTGPRQGVSASAFLPFEERRTDLQTADWLLEQLRRPAFERPRLLMAWTHGADAPGHREGPDGEDVHRAMRAADAFLARLREGIRSLGPQVPVDLVVASDHGMAAVERTVDVVPLVPKRGFYPYIAPSGPVCNLYVKDEAQRGAVREALRRLPKDVRVYEKGTVPRTLAYDGNARIGDFVLLCPRGATFAGFGRKEGGNQPKGMHGYPPGDVPEMAGILYAEGPGIPAGLHPRVARVVDVAPTVCALLGLPPPPHADGAPLIP